MSTRTLQRRLKGERATFQATILDSTHESLARHYLSRSELSAGEISFLLGYDDPRSFYRAFRTWTGQTPQLVRAATGSSISGHRQEDRAIRRSTGVPVRSSRPTEEVSRPVGTNQLGRQRHRRFCRGLTTEVLTCQRLF